MAVHILLVDDSIAARAMAARLRREFGHQVDLAFDGWAALEWFETNRHPLVLIDNQVPGMDGIELFGRMRKLRADTVGILLSGNATINIVYRAIDAGFLQVLAKPVDFRELLPIIKECAGPSERPTIETAINVNDSPTRQRSNGGSHSVLTGQSIGPDLWPVA